MATVELIFCRGCAGSADVHRALFIVGRLQHLESVPWGDVKGALVPHVDEETWRNALKLLQPSPTDTCPLWLNLVTVAALPSKVSRHNTPSSAHALTRLVQTCFSRNRSGHIMVVCERSSVFASACAVARAFPLYNKTTGQNKNSAHHCVTVEFVCVGQDDEPLSKSALTCLSCMAESIRLAARIVDAPCSEMDTEHFLEEVRMVGLDLKIAPTIIRGEELRERGFGGIYGAGSAAASPPALAVLSHTPPAATQTIAWVGEGVVYDTGGLIVKGKTQMPGMKRDCAGAAAILGAFSAAVKQVGSRSQLISLWVVMRQLCTLRDNLGPVVTVEIRNTDAEGRLLLADGVVYAGRDLKADIILDMATLMGAQGVATGKYHGALLTNREDWERACVCAGRSSGDLVQPLVYSPELHFSEFSSAMADMRNVDRNNAPCSCAGLFVGAQLGFSWGGAWIHLDVAFPCHSGERATGYGVALLLALFGQATDCILLQEASPLGAQRDACHLGGSSTRSTPKRRRLI